MDRKELLNIIQTFNNNLRILDVMDFYDIDYDEESNGRYRAICPFHSDHSPSLILYTENESGHDSWWCPPCDENGDCFRFIQMMEGDFKKSIEVAKDIVKKTKVQGRTLSIEHKEAQTKRRQQKRLLAKAHLLGVEYRIWLKSLWGSEIYHKACQKVDSIFEEMDRHLRSGNYNQAVDFLREKRRKLKGIKENGVQRPKSR